MNDAKKKALGEIKKMVVEQKEKRDGFFQKVENDVTAFLKERIAEGATAERVEEFAQEITDMLTLRTALEDVIPKLKSLEAITMCLMIIGIFATPGEAGARGVLDKLSLNSKQDNIVSLLDVIDRISEFLNSDKNDGTADYLLNSGTLNKLKC